MTPTQAKTIAEFMRRCQLKGDEVPAFIECMKALNEIVQPRPAVSEVGADPEIERALGG